MSQYLHFFKHLKPVFYARLFDESENWPFEVPPGCTNKDEIIKLVPGAPKLYALKENNSAWVFCSFLSAFFFVGDKLAADDF